MRRAGIAGIALAAVFLMIAPGAWAAGGMKLCVPKAEGASLVTPKHGKCKKGYKLTTLGAEGAGGKAGVQGKAGAEGKEGKTGSEGKLALTSGELETLRSILPHIGYVGSGIAGKPTVEFSGVNVQIVNGEGKTESTNGAGNLVIGYDENTGVERGGPPGTQTGSHNLIVGEEHEFTSFGGIVAGFANTILAPYASVTGGKRNVAEGELSSVTGGIYDEARGRLAWASGGDGNVPSGSAASDSGGFSNQAKGNYSSIFGGKNLTAAVEYEAIP